MSEKVAFVVPCHPPHYHFINDFLDSFHKFGMEDQSDVVLVLTNEEDEKRFLGQPHGGDNMPVRLMILPPEYRNTINRNIPSIKKFYAVYQLKKTYEYIIVIDAETVFKKRVDLKTVCEKFFREKVLWGNQTTGSDANIEFIKNSCARWFSYHPEKSKLSSPLYLWFNQPCFYKTSMLDEFFRVTGLMNHFNSLAWSDFEYYIYMYYLILYHGFRTADIGIKNNVSICETRKTVNVDSKNPQFKPLMCSKAMVDNFDNDELFLVIHLDRK